MPVPDTAAALSAPPERPGLFALECSLATSTLDTLEALDRRLPSAELLALFARTEELGELAVLRTCHRFELFCWTASPARVRAAVDREIGAPVEWRTHVAEGAVRHLFRVAAGLESTALGEREVREQVRAAAFRVQSRSPRPLLRPLLLEAVRVAEETLPRVPKSRSIAALAAARVLEEVAAPFPRILVVGSGIVGRAVAEHLAPYGRVTIVYRNRPPDAGFLRASAARAVPWQSLSEEVALADVVVTAVKTAGRILGPAELGPRSRPLVVIDLGLPRNVDPALRGHPALQLVDLEGLRGRSAAPAPPELEERIEEQAPLAAEAVARAGFEAWVDSFRRGAEAERQSLLEAARSSLGTLSPEEWEAVDRLTRRLTSRLLAGPTAGLRAIPPGAEGDERRRWAWELLSARTPKS